MMEGDNDDGSLSNGQGEKTKGNAPAMVEAQLPLLPEALLLLIFEYSAPRLVERRWPWIHSLAGTCRIFRKLAKQHCVPAVFDNDIIFADVRHRRYKHLLCDQAGVSSLWELIDQERDNFARQVDLIQRESRGAIINLSQLLEHRAPRSMAKDTFSIDHITTNQAPRFLQSFMACTWACKAVTELRIKADQGENQHDRLLLQALLSANHTFPNVKRLSLATSPEWHQQHPRSFFQTLPADFRHQLEHLTLLNAPDRLPDYALHNFAFMFPNLKTLEITLDCCDDNEEWLVFHPLSGNEDDEVSHGSSTAAVWSQLEEFIVHEGSCDEVHGLHGLSLSAKNLKYLKIDCFQFCSEELEAILLANPGLEDLCLKGGVRYLDPPDLRNIRRLTHNLRRLCTGSHFRELNETTLADLISPQSMLHTLSVEFTDIGGQAPPELCVAAFRQLFTNGNSPPYLGKSGGAIYLRNYCQPKCLESLRSEFPDRKWLHAGEDSDVCCHH